MNQADFHLALNHLPMIIPIVGFLVMISGIGFKLEVIKRTGYLLFVLGALCTFPAFQTGEGAEEIVEDMQGISETYIHKHEDTAKTFALLSYSLGIISLFGFFASWKGYSFAMFIPFVAVAFSVVVLFFAKQTGTTGGEIRHTEIRSNGGEANQKEAKEKDSDDKD